VRCRSCANPEFECQPAYKFLGSSLELAVETGNSPSRYPGEVLPMESEGRGIVNFVMAVRTILRVEIHALGFILGVRLRGFAGGSLV
jgi:hypothetical protein